MNKKNRTVELINGVNMPVIGFGTDMTFVYIRKNILAGIKDFAKDIIKNNAYCFKRDMSINKIVSIAPKLGCNLFDTARAYGQSERVLGSALKKYKREDVFIVTKLSNSDQKKGNVEQALRTSLKRLNMEYVDLYLMHWPQTDTFIESWKQIELLYKKGLAKAIGVCNFNEHHFEELKQYAEIMPMVNQYECHPLFAQKTLENYCYKNNIQVMAYTPTGRMDKRITENKNLKVIANNYRKSVAQVIVRWHYQQGRVPVINTTKIEHVKENIDIFDFELSDGDMKKIDSININCRLRYDPDNCDFTKL